MVLTNPSTLMNGSILHNAGGHRVHLYLSVPKMPLKPAFDSLVLETFWTEKPFLNSIEIKGAISGNLELTGIGENWTAMGHCLWRDGQVLSGDNGFFCNKIDLDLPVWYQTRICEDVGKNMKGKYLLNK